MSSPLTSLIIVISLATCGLVYASKESISSYHDSNGDIPVNILIKPLREFERKIYVPTGANITATAEILDEKFRNTTVTYQWTVKNKTIITDQNASHINYIYQQADENNFLKVLIFHKPNDTGVCQKDVVIRDPIVMSDPMGKFFLEHGELLNVTLNYSGTGPFRYCQSFCFEERQNGCKECSPSIWTQNNRVNIVKYLHSVGNYSLIFVLDNFASRVVKSYSVKITDTTRHQTTPYVPIVCSAVAVFILLTGAFLHSKFKNNIPSETADFDFTRTSIYDDDEDEEFWDEEQSFFQRAKYLLLNSGRRNRNSFVDVDLSGSRSRLF